MSPNSPFNLADAISTLPIIITSMDPREQVNRIEQFISYFRLLRGDEKGEAHVFCDRLFQAFGHQGYKEAGAVLEQRVQKKGERTKFADLRWSDRLILEMKSRGVNLARHYRQAFDYWVKAVPNRPRYVVLCNFDEIWIYDFDLQLDEPVDIVKTLDLPQRYSALNFLLAEFKQPIFRNDLVAVTRAAAAKVAAVFNSLVNRGEDRVRAQRFVLQCVMGMFSEDFGLLPKDLFTELVIECKKGASTYDLLGALFAQMNSSEGARGGRFKHVRYFNGGLFARVEPIELNPDELGLLESACTENWSKVKPAIFGTLFQSSMGKGERHAYGAHFTSEVDINKVVSVTVEKPWRDALDKTSTLQDLLKLKARLHEYTVLDPACGSGNFLYLAYLQLRRVENDLVAKVYERFGVRATQRVLGMPSLQLQQFHGIDNYSFAVELAKVTLILAKEIALTETKERFKSAQVNLLERDLPLDNLDGNIRCEDALFCEWPSTDAVIGNPPYQSKNKMQTEFGAAYLHRLRTRYPEVPGRADYCVYWFRRAHDELRKGGRAGLVGTNTIRQNYSREGGLDYIVQRGGTIVEAVSSQVWSGDAVVHVSIVNWVKGQQKGLKKLYTQLGDCVDGPWRLAELPEINSALSAEVDVSGAEVLKVNRDADACDQGQTHGHKGFLLTPEDAQKFIEKDARNAEVLFPYLTGDELLGTVPPRPQRYVIDFFPRDLNEASSFNGPFNRVRELVLPVRQAAAAVESKRNKEVLEEDPKAHVNLHHHNFLSKWWLLSYPRGELIRKLRQMNRYIVCSAVTKRPVFEFIDSAIRPNAALVVFLFDDDYSFGVLQSEVHWEWFNARCSTLKADYRYTSNTVFDTFAWPQRPTLPAITRVANAARTLRGLRCQIMAKTGMSLRDMYRALELPGDNPLRKAHDDLDSAVRIAYGMTAREDALKFLMKLNDDVRRSESSMGRAQGPGLPARTKNKEVFVSDDRVVLSS